MKRLMSTVIAGAMALSLVSAPAMASPRHGGSDNGAAIAAGIGMVALFAILASQNNDRDDRVYVRDYRDDRGWGHRRGWRDRDDRGWRDRDGYRYDRDRRW